LTGPAAIQGDYVDLRFIKTRKVLQIVIELPIEAGPAVVHAFGTPLPDTTVPVAVARLSTPDSTYGVNSGPSQCTPPKERRNFNAMTRAQQAGILCNEDRFQKFLEVVHKHIFLSPETVLGLPEINRKDQAAALVRRICKVNSRADLDTTLAAGEKWDALEKKYRAWPGFSV